MSFKYQETSDTTYSRYLLSHLRWEFVLTISQAFPPALSRMGEKLVIQCTAAETQQAIGPHLEGSANNPIN